ncbi:hypothetical protein O1L60_45320 [Streptomyces diastatochromogenes]|nr:hypothetical protein [Streptomyces diastatochromogenes]
MTVTFTAALRPPAGFVVGCGCPEATARAPRFGAFQDAQEAADRANAAPARDARSPAARCPWCARSTRCTRSRSTPTARCPR